MVENDKVKDYPKQDDAYKNKWKKVKGQQTIKKIVSDTSAQTLIKNFIQKNMNTFASLQNPL